MEEKVTPLSSNDPPTPAFFTSPETALQKLTVTSSPPTLPYLPCKILDQTRTRPSATPGSIFWGCGNFDLTPLAILLLYMYAAAVERSNILSLANEHACGSISPSFSRQEPTNHHRTNTHTLRNLTRDYIVAHKTHIKSHRKKRTK